MYRKVLVGGVTAAAIIGAGTTAMAVTGSSTTTGTPSSTSTGQAHSAKAGKAGKAGKGGKAGKAGKAGKLLRHTVHAQIVTKGKDGFVTHDIINGTVTAVSPTSITVLAADKTSETFGITTSTVVRARSNGKPAASTISKVAKGDHVLVAGTGTSTYTAKHVVDLGTK